MERKLRKIITRLLPNFIKRLFIKKKYFKYNILIHKSNISNDKLIKINCLNENRYIFLKKSLKKSFNSCLNIKNYSIYFHPIAIIKVPENIDTYLKEIGTKSRNMNVKAIKNGIYCEVFDWNQYLDDIYEINTSSINRQGRKMDQTYVQYPKKIENIKEYDFSITYIGSFIDKKLIGYVELYNYGNFTMTNRILGHKDYLKFGVMNLLVKYCVEYAIKSEKIEYINYLTMQNKENNSLSAFKNRVGFEEYSLLELQ